VVGQIASGDHRIMGVMLESNWWQAREIVKRETLVYGQSITDACIVGTKPWGPGAAAYNNDSGIHVTLTLKPLPGLFLRPGP